MLLKPAEQNSLWFPELAETFYHFPRSGTSETAPDWLSAGQGGLTATKETAAVHIVHSQAARAPVYQLNRPPGLK